MFFIVNGGLLRGGVGIWRMGSGGVRLLRGLVIFGIVGMRGGRLSFFLLILVGEVVVSEVNKVVRSISGVILIVDINLMVKFWW